MQNRRAALHDGPVFISQVRGMPDPRIDERGNDMTSTTANVASETAVTSGWLKRFLAALDQMCGSSADGARGF